MIRQQMEEDFLLHSERIGAQKQSVQRVERALEVMSEDFTAMLSKIHASVGQLRREFHEFGHSTRSCDETWAIERKRNIRMLEVIQAGLLTGGLETDSRLAVIERRLARLEENQSGVA